MCKRGGVLFSDSWAEVDLKRGGGVDKAESFRLTCRGANVCMHMSDDLHAVVARGVVIGWGAGEGCGMVACGVYVMVEVREGPLMCGRRGNVVRVV